MSIKSKVRKLFAVKSEPKPEAPKPEAPFGRDKFGAPKSRG